MENTTSQSLLTNTIIKDDLILKEAEIDDFLATAGITSSFNQGTFESDI